VKVKPVVVVTLLTVTATGDEVLEVKLLSPEYCAVIELAATGKLDVVNEAVEEFVPGVRVSEPRRVVPLKKSTVPVGAPVSVPTGVTVAVKVTVWP
jgi:hypothetical protein